MLQNKKYNMLLKILDSKTQGNCLLTETDPYGYDEEQNVIMHIYGGLEQERAKYLANVKLNKWWKSYFNN